MKLSEQITPGQWIKCWAYSKEMLSIIERLDNAVTISPNKSREEELLSIAFAASELLNKLNS